MTKELDTSWFDLKNYEAFKTMPLREWIRQLFWRWRCNSAFSSFINNRELSALSFDHGTVHIKLLTGDEAINHLWSQAATLKAGVIPLIPNYYDMTGVVGRKYPFATASVNSLDSISLWKMANDPELGDVWKACQFEHDVTNSDIADTRDDDHNDHIEEPYDVHLKKFKPYYERTNAHLIIDLEATDEQIKNDFNHWLTHYRQAIGIYSQKKSFTQSDFDYWIQYGAIPYLDLNIIAKIEGKKITQNKLARLIFPDDYDVDIVGRLRQVTKPIAEMLIKYETWRALTIQITHEINGMKNT